MTSLTFRCVSVSRALAAGTAHQARRHTHFGSHEALNHLFSAASPAACAGAVGRSPQWQPLSTHDWRNPARCAGVSAHRGTRGVLCATRAHPQVPPLRRGAASRYTDGDPGCRSRRPRCRRVSRANIVIENMPCPPRTSCAHAEKLSSQSAPTRVAPRAAASSSARCARSAL